MTTIERSARAVKDGVPMFRLRSQMNGIAEAPNKVWFFELAAAVIDADRCVRCGACIAACPTDSLGIDPYDLPYLVKMCTGCSLCWDFCPRGGLRYEATWLDATEPEEVLPARIVGENPPLDLGKVVSQVQARVRADSKLAPRRAQDGGVVSAILLGALESGLIDGVLLAREDPERPWRAMPYLATTPGAILACAGSFYNQTLALGALDFSALETTLGREARIALVGTPCEIQGIRALQARAYRRGVSRVDAVSLTIALLCTKSFDYEKLILGEFEHKRGLDPVGIGKVDVIHGRMIVEDRAGAVLVDEPVKEFHGAALKGCDECADFLGRAADISVGSVGSPAGYSSVLLRTKTGLEAFEQVAGELELGEIERPEALAKLDALDRRIATAALERVLEPDGPLFIDFAEHLEAYNESERRPVWRGW